MSPSPDAQSNADRAAAAAAESAAAYEKYVRKAEPSAADEGATAPAPADDGGTEARPAHHRAATPSEGGLRGFLRRLFGVK